MYFLSCGFIQRFTTENEDLKMVIKIVFLFLPMSHTHSETTHVTHKKIPRTIRSGDQKEEWI